LASRTPKQGVIPAKAVIQFLCNPPKGLITRRYCGVPFGPFAPASCLRSTAFAGMTSKKLIQAALRGHTPVASDPCASDASFRCGPGCRRW
jgi:hypothetical protein